MSETDGVQLISLGVCLLTVPIWVQIGRVNRRVGWWAAIPVSCSLVTAVYYVLVVFTPLSELYRDLFTLVSALLRLYVQSFLLWGGLLMYRRYKRAGGHE